MSKFIKKTVADVIREHPEITLWDVEVYSIMNDHTETIPNEDTYLYDDNLLELDDEYSFCGDMEELEDYHETYGDIDDPDDYGVLSYLECEFSDFTVLEHENGKKTAYISFARDDVSQYILNPKHLHQGRKIHTYLAGDYILLREYENTALFANDEGDYIVAIDVIKDDDTHYQWCQGMYFVGNPNTTPKGNTLAKAVNYFEKKIAE